MKFLVVLKSLKTWRREKKISFEFSNEFNFELSKYLVWDVAQQFSKKTDYLAFELNFLKA